MKLGFAYGVYGLSVKFPFGAGSEVGPTTVSSSSTSGSSLPALCRSACDSRLPSYSRRAAVVSPADSCSEGRSEPLLGEFSSQTLATPFLGTPSTHAFLTSEGTIPLHPTQHYRRGG